EVWDLYDKKVAKPKAESLWKKLSKKDRDDCMEYIPKYSKAQPNKKYRKNPDTFLRNKSWNDELVSDSKEEKEYSNVDIEKYKEAFE
nr:hypothetical protein [bacterium]